MKNLIFFKLVFISVIFYSCSSEESLDDTTSSDKLVSSEYYTNNYKINYRYNDSNLLSEIIDVIIEDDIDLQTNYVYGLDQLIISSNIQSNITNFNGDTDFSYNANNKLVGLTTVSNTGTDSTWELAYEDNTITLNINPANGNIRTIVLEANNSGLIRKATYSGFYVIIDYDSNGNITKINTFDSDDVLMNNTEYTYDSKPNPFYGQLKSIYIPIFINAFADAYDGEFLFDGYEGYYFPFLKNNIISKFRSGNLVRSYSYSYDSENYPINVKEVYNGNYGREYDIYY
ncbi:MAG: hypothetical protein CL526_12285 [Aequorivita sp.]|nr:hypothetical protein [Aequorivita sp.]|tara:strand:- start:72067 stop:72927 length:861 start_codon:yes stop_codon:yes gene_type:complete